MSYFKNIVLGLFIAGGVFGVMIFGGIIKIGGSGGGPTEVTGTATMWGTFSSQAMNPLLAHFADNNPNLHINYVEKDPATFSTALVEAMASGKSPDLVIMPDFLINHFKDKLRHIPFTSMPADTYNNTYVSASDIFAAPDGYLAIPWAADPVIMYYNRDLLQSAGIVNPPKNWQQFTDSVALLTKKQSDLTLTQSATALGTYSNIAHAKDIIALLFLENGNGFMTYDYNDFSAHFGDTPSELAVASQALDFYTSFANPIKAVYSWNAGQKLDREMFLQSSLAYYFGSASELPGIRSRNPNLNFEINLPPQSTNGNILTTGRIYGLSIPKAAPNMLLSFTIASALAGTDSEAALSGDAAITLSLLPVRRDVLANSKISDKYLNFLYKTALVQKSWFDPNPVESDRILGDMIKTINSSLDSISGALGTAQSKLQAVSKQ